MTSDGRHVVGPVPGFKSSRIYGHRRDRALAADASGLHRWKVRFIPSSVCQRRPPDGAQRNITYGGDADLGLRSWLARLLARQGADAALARAYA